jgi:hypothetical protein
LQLILTVIRGQDNVAGFSITDSGAREPEQRSGDAP